MSAQSGSGAGVYLLKRIPAGVTGKVFFQDYVVNAIDQSSLAAAAKDDSYRYAYNGIVSFLGALSGLRNNQAAWAVTKMYYSAFYIARATLCRNGHLIFHVPKEGTSRYTQYELKVSAGERASTSSISSTHKLVASLFQKSGYPTFMQGLVIDGLDPINWLMEQREYWQYRSGRFSDPEFPRILAELDTQRLQRFLTAYEQDERGIYLSDPDHALIAIPFRLVTWYLSIASFAGTSLFTPEDFAHLQKSCIAGNQKLTPISRLLNAR
jgi:hypothetical protein